MNLFLIIFLLINISVRPITKNLSIYNDGQCIAFDNNFDLNKHTFGPYVKQTNYRYYLASNENKNIYNPFEEKYGLSIPTIIDIFDEFGGIGICVEYGIYGDGYPNIEKNDEAFSYSPDGMQYVYLGHLINNDDNFFAVKGEWIKELTKLENNYEGNYDFYIFFDENELFITFNEICK